MVLSLQLLLKRVSNPSVKYSPTFTRILEPSKSNNTLVDGVPPHVHRPPSGGPHTGLAYSEASGRHKGFKPNIFQLGPIFYPLTSNPHYLFWYVLDSKLKLK